MHNEQGVPTPGGTQMVAEEIFNRADVRKHSSEQVYRFH